MHRATFDLVWLSVLILTPGVGVPAGPGRSARLFHFGSGWACRRVGVVPGWPGTVGTRPAPTASAAEGASGGGGRSGPAEPGCLISWARMVPVMALARKAEARRPAARVRLNAIAAKGTD